LQANRAIAYTHKDGNFLLYNRTKKLLQWAFREVKIIRAGNDLEGIIYWAKKWGVDFLIMERSKKLEKNVKTIIWANQRWAIYDIR